MDKPALVRNPRLSGMEKLFHSYQALNIKARAALWFAICSVLNKGILMIVVPVYTRLLTMEEYGTYTLFQAWINIFAIFATLEISQAHYAVGITRHEDVDAYTSGMLGLGNAVTALVLIVYLCAVPVFNQWLTLTMPIVMGMLLFLFVFPAWEFWVIQQRFKYNYKKMVGATLFVAVLSPILGILGILGLGLQSEAAIFSRLLVQGGLAAVIYIGFLRKNHHMYHRKIWREGFTFSVTLMPYLLSTLVLDQADRIMIRNMIGSTAAAIYSVAYSAAMILQLVNNAINDAIEPWIFQKLKEKRYGEIEPAVNRLLILVAVCNLLLVLFAPEVISFFAPSSYLDAIWAIPPITASVFFMFLFQRYINVEVYYGGTVNISITSIAVAVLNIMLNWVFLPMYGYIAAGYTTLFCYITFSAAHYFALRKLVGKRCAGEKIFTARTAVVVGCLFLGCIFTLTSLYPYRIPRYFFALCVCAYLIRQRDFIRGFAKRRGDNKDAAKG